MTLRHAQRQSRVRLMAAIAGGLALLAAGAEFTGRTAEPRSDQAGKPVLPGFAELRETASEIRITLADESYALAASPDGWSLSEASGYPVRPDRLNELATGLQELSWDAPRTRDPDKLNLIGLGDPREGGTGALIEVIGPGGDVTAALITGRKDGFIYARLPGDPQAFRVTGELPPLYSAEAWLDLTILELNPDAVAAIRLTDMAGRSLYLRRFTGESDQAFRPAPPFQDYERTNRLVTTGPALALARLQPLGVKPESALQSRPVARHVTETFDGLEVDVQAWREPDGLYITLRAVEAGEGAHRAAAINTRASGWAFRLSEVDWADFTPPVDAIARLPAADETIPDETE